MSRQAPADPNDSLVTITAPILAGFSLAAITVIGTTASLSGRPLALPAVACFAGASVLLVFSMQMLAVAAFAGLGTRGKTWAARFKSWLYELGLLAFLVGLELFLWSHTWSAAEIAAVTIVGAAIAADLVVTGIIWCRYGSRTGASATG